MTELATASDAVAAEQAVSVWLVDFNAALEAGDASAVAGLFAATSFWRDLVALTWNITAVEGRDGVRAMLEHTLASAQARDFRLSEAPTERPRGRDVRRSHRGVGADRHDLPRGRAQLGDHEDQVRHLVLGLLDAGYESQILLSQDVGQVVELRARRDVRCSRPLAPTGRHARS